jgi:hypothetical protein
MKNFADAKAYLASGRNPDNRPLPVCATRVIRRDANTIVVQYHNTDVVTYKADGRVILNSGGWKTPTTKARMNEFAPLIIDQTNGIWRVYVPNQPGVSALFADGITWNGRRFTGAAASPKAELRLRKQIREYSREYIRKLAWGRIPTPPKGWESSVPPVNQRTLIKYITKSVYVPKLIVLAFNAQQAAPMQWAGLRSLWGYSNDDSYREYATDNCSYRMLVRFLYRALGLAG